MVHLNDSLTLLGVRSGSSVLHILDSVLDRNDVSELEESRLKNSIDPVAQTDLLADLNAVDDIELDVVLSDISLYLTRQMLVKLLLCPLAVEQESSARLDVVDDVVLGDVRLVVASYEVSLIDEVGRLDRSLAESEVRNRYAAGLLGVISEVSLSIQVGVVTDDLDRVLVCTNSTVSAQTPELAGSSALGSGVELALALERKICNVVIDADSESWLESILPGSVPVNSLDLIRSSIL